jgi:hypothetical protein
MSTRQLWVGVAVVWIAVAGALLAFVLPSVLDDVTLRKKVTGHAGGDKDEDGDGDRNRGGNGPTR